MIASIPCPLHGDQPAQITRPSSSVVLIQCRRCWYRGWLHTVRTWQRRTR